VQSLLDLDLELLLGHRYRNSSSCDWWCKWSTAGASASGDRSVAIGNGASAALADAIILGSTSTAIRVGIGINASLAAKLDVVESMALLSLESIK